MPENVESPRATSAATSLQEYRAAKAAPPATTEAKPEEKKPEVSEQTAKAESGSAAAPEAPKQETQDKGKPKDRSAEGRATELSAQGRYDEARKILEAKDRKREEEIAELRKKLEAPPQAPSKPAAESEAKTTPNGPPKLKDFLAKPENKNREYDDVVDDWEEAKYEWRKTKERAETEGAARAKTINEKINEGRTKHGADFDAALKVQLHDVNIQALIHRIDNGMDVLMALHQDPAEHARIHALDPVSQLIELGLISRDLKAEAKAAATPPTTEKPQLVPPVSRTSAPPRSLGGLAPGEKSTKTPTTLAEHRANKAAK